MPDLTEAAGPSYISSHSADVILSDIRPIKLKIEALRSINVLLDEFLYSILSAACSLSTDKLRASLLGLLPTNLGKEALLEAEVELRAYWDRTGPADVTVSSLADDNRTFHLQWAFELLRLKCEAYSTLNESDENPDAEARINSSMSGPPPKAALLAPAALYLTAILEAMCEHILSNVGRVASRDSSRTSATAQDLFVALCEDHAIYGLFRTMKVYEQIEQLSKAPKARRSKSISRADRHSRTSSPHQDLLAASDSSSAVPRRSSEVSGTTTMNGLTSISVSGSRSSFEKTRAMKMFSAGKTPGDRDGDSQNGHKRVDSLLSETTGQALATAYGDTEAPAFEDEAMLQEFDDLMRSSSTMKVSLTPDRLKTMEVYKQEKTQRGNRRPVPLSFKSEPDSSVLSPRLSSRLPSLLRVDSIKEDEEENTFKSPSQTTRSRQASVSSPSAPVATSSRVRSVSTSGITPRILTKLSRSTVYPVSMPHTTTSNAITTQAHNRRTTKVHDPFPPRTRKVQHNRESIDLDDIMVGSDDEGFAPAISKRPAAMSNRPGQHAVSASTRDLIDFLAEGPPDLASGDMAGFLTDVPHGYHASAESGKPKSSGRLQRMISKLSLGNSEKSRGVPDDFSKSKAPPGVIVRPNLQTKSSAGNLSSLANRPIPPRIPRPISPPSSPSRGSSDDQNYNSVSSRGPPLIQSKQQYVEAQSPVTSPSKISREEYRDSVSSLNRRQPPHPVDVNGYSKDGTLEKFLTTVQPVTSATNAPPSNSANSRVDSPPLHSRAVKAATVSTSPVRKPAPVYVASASTPHLSGNDVRDMHRLLAKAVSADECRLIYDMFLTKSGIPVASADYDVPYPSPSPSVVARTHATPSDTALEHTLIELLLGGDHDPELGTRKRRAKRGKRELVLAEPLPRGSYGDEATSGGSLRVGNGEPHRSNGNLQDGREVIVSSPGSKHAAQHLTQLVSQVGT